MTKFYIDAIGNYLGGFDGAAAPAAAIEVADPPAHGAMTWDGKAWQTPTALATALVDEARRKAYPPIGDQLDAIWKQLNQDRLGGKALIQEADDRLGEILGVKAAHPK